MQNVDLFRHKLAFIINSNHALFFAGIDNGLAWYQQHLLASGIQFQIGIHARLEKLILIRNLETDLKRTGCLIHAGKNIPFFDMECFIRISRYRNFKLRRIFQQIGDRFWHCSADPDRVHSLNLSHHLIFRNIHAGAQVKCSNDTINRCFNGKTGLNAPGRTQSLNILFRHTCQAKPFQNAFNLRGSTTGAG
ncbi:hypothetical protein ESCOCP322M2_24550 [Escherichia coli]